MSESNIDSGIATPGNRNIGHEEPEKENKNLVGGQPNQGESEPNLIESHKLDALKRTTDLNKVWGNAETRVRFENLMREIKALNLTYRKHAIHILYEVAKFNRGLQEKCVHELKFSWNTLGTFREQIKYATKHPDGEHCQYTDAEIEAYFQGIASDKGGV